MGNICCQTEATSSPFENDILKIDEYQQQELPRGDETFN